MFRQLRKGVPDDLARFLIDLTLNLFKILDCRVLDLRHLFDCQVSVVVQVGDQRTHECECRDPSAVSRCCSAKRDIFPPGSLELVP